ncbi:hypothetical protein GGR08_000520 [Bartonella fuyuanensis]|uniref:Uncharacterized protein n=1 Tax=Bartonella fuyuanensis TaxID=1460968 RepID=A0A840E013_9HYPH|nr:hypothetical protein [Bartonella fuyuanensis]
MIGGGKVALLLKNDGVFSFPLVIGLIKTHILFSTTVFLYAALFAVFCGS